ncbi:hypothetical protein [Deinococcus yunweiensis]|uniref:hypothetical protein n=1 Tax=Deinococcus yunweiensis TaxID=367282 RepID=UPI00398E5A8E
MSALALRPVADTTRQARLAQIAPGPWPEVGLTARHPGEPVPLLRGSGVTGDRGRVNLVRWTLSDTPHSTLPDHAAVRAPWPGQRGVLMVAGVQEVVGRWHDAQRDAVLGLAAVWARPDGEACASLGGQDGRAVPMPP